MSRQLTNNLLRAIHLQETDEVFLPLVRLMHPDWAEDVRLVADHRDLTHNGEVFTAHAFAITLPEDDPETLPVLQWKADAVSQDLVIALRGVTGKIDAEVFYVLASTPDIVEVGPFEVEMQAVGYDSQQIGGTMTIEQILDEPFGHMKLTPSIAPALF
jgi:uncharacterized protein DUF1833